MVEANPGRAPDKADQAKTEEDDVEAQMIRAGWSPEVEGHAYRNWERDEKNTGEAQTPEAKADQVKQDEQPDLEAHGYRGGYSPEVEGHGGRYAGRHGDEKDTGDAQTPEAKADQDKAEEDDVNAHGYRGEYAPRSKPTASVSTVGRTRSHR